MVYLGCVGSQGLGVGGFGLRIRELGDLGQDFVSRMRCLSVKGSGGLQCAHRKLYTYKKL